jgi:hypothetical protein
MNNEQQELLDEAYKNYYNSHPDAEKTFQYEGHTIETRRMTNDEFVFMVKIDPEFSERWGLKIEERELSDEESIFHYEKELYSPLRIIDQKIPVIPTKLITITYNDKIIESYEYKNKI